MGPPAHGWRFSLKYIQWPSSSEIVERHILGWHAPIVAHLNHGLVHQWWATEVKLDVLWSLMGLKVMLNDCVVNESKEAIAIVVNALLFIPIVLL